MAKANIHRRSTLEEIYPPDVFASDAAQNGRVPSTVLSGVRILSAPDAAGDFARAGAVVVGVSKDSAASHGKFRAKYGLGVTLGSAKDDDMVERYGAWVEKSLYGRKYMGIDRSTFLIDKAGVIRRVWRKVKVPGHAAQVLAEAKSLTTA